MLNRLTEPFVKLGKAINDSMGDVFLLTAKIMFIGVVLGLIATVAILVFTFAIMLILG